MPLTKENIDEIHDIAHRFVRDFVKCCEPPYKYSVMSALCETLEEAVDFAMQRCSRSPLLRVTDAEAQEWALREELTVKIKNLKCQ